MAINGAAQVNTDSVKMDSVLQRFNNLPDSIKNKTERIQQKQDSLKNKLGSAQDNLDSISHLPQRALDRLQSNKPGVPKVTVPGAAEKDKVENKIETGVENAERKVKSKVENAGEKINSAVDESRSRVENNLSSVEQKNILDAVDKTGVKKDALALPEIAPSYQVPSIPDIHVKDVNLPDLDKTLEVNPGTINLQDKLPGKIDVDLPATDSLGKLNLKGLKDAVNSDKLGDATDELEKLGGKVDQLDEYSEEVEKLKEEGLRDVDTGGLEEQARKVDELKTLSAEEVRLKEIQLKQQQMIDKYKDQKLVQQELQRQMKQVRNDVVNKYSPEVSNIMKQTATVRKFSLKRKTVKHIFKQSGNELKHVPFRQRIVPELTFQPISARVFQTDVSAQLSYKFTRKWWLGSAFIYRIGFSDEYPAFVRGEHIYGIRGLTSFKLNKGIFAQAEYESIKYNLPAQSTENKLTVNNGVILGLGKRFKISKRFNSSTLILYRTHINNRVPGTTKLAVRIAFGLNKLSK